MCIPDFARQGPGVTPERAQRNRKRVAWNGWRIVLNPFWTHKGDCSDVFLAMERTTDE
jgi:hypothetical protein